MDIARQYETIFIAKPEISPDDLKGLGDKIKDIIDQGAGQLGKFEEWGVRRLAYEVRKQNRGFYFFTGYFGSTKLVRELERNLKIDDRVIKYLTVRIGDASSAETAQPEAGATKAEPGEKAEPKPQLPEEIS
ncbi:MAG: 30S ribosomal protein S6 [Pseudomonadota bacterium]